MWLFLAFCWLCVCVSLGWGSTLHFFVVPMGVWCLACLVQFLRDIHLVGVCFLSNIDVF